MILKKQAKGTFYDTIKIKHGVFKPFLCNLKQDT